MLGRLRRTTIALQAALAAALAAPSPADACPADCSGDLRVSLAELITCVGAGLDPRGLDACPQCDADRDGSVSIEDLVAGVGAAVQNLIVTAGGTCMRPGSGPGGLEACPPDTAVRFSRCQNRATCLNDATGRAPLDEGGVGENGAFSLRTCDAVGATLLFEADVDPPSATTYRVLSFGPAGASFGSAGAGAGTAALDDVSISPRSEAAVRVVADNGLDNFAREGLVEIIATVEQQTADIDFSDLDAARAADTAEKVAAADMEVQDAIERNRITPTPTPTGTPTPSLPPTATPSPIPTVITSEGTVVASSVFGDDEFPADRAVDGKLDTAWFSDGDVGGATETFRWTGTRDDLIQSIAVLANAEPRFPGFGFGSVRIELRDAADQVAFAETRALPGAADPDVAVFPNAVGRSVLLTFTGHDDPACGGFSELVITALR